MGSIIELNDTLKISRQRGFPNISLEEHQTHPNYARQFLGQTFEFWNKDERLYNRPPTRVFLVEEAPNGKWIYWGHTLIREQTIADGETRGTFEIVKIYEPSYQRLVTDTESPEGKSFFQGRPRTI